ncbi:MAG: HAD hydrolase family protein [Bdellovibrionales bacterium]|nr:HAD hydrolase family protein [Bdellovibrionales bacterium]
MEKWKKIKCLALDVDGVLTDGHIFQGLNGQWCRNFYIRDGMGLVLLKERGYKLALITSSLSDDIRDRAKKLKIDHVFDNVSNKAEAFKKLLQDSGLQPDEIAYMGDDIIDLPVLEQVGISLAPADAHIKVKNAVEIVTAASGGRGAVREVCDTLLEQGAL